MVSNEGLKNHLMDCKEVSYVDVSGDGYHYQLTIVSDAFVGLPPVQRQQWVYAKIKDYITKGDLHACTMRTWTQSEWERHRG